MADNISIKMLGEFSLSNGKGKISNSDNRSYKIWLLLAYIIYSRNTPVSQDRLVSIIWGDNINSSNPANALKTIFHRLRALLDTIEPGLGHKLIVRKDGSYVWNSAVPTDVDIDKFEEYCKSGAACTSDDEKIKLYKKALSLYVGDFLPKLSSEPWVVPVNTYFHSLYISTLCETLDLLESKNCANDIVEISYRAVYIEPFNEIIYEYLMRNLIALDRKQEAVDVYDKMSVALFENFGIMPSEPIRQLYHEAAKTINLKELNINTLRDQLSEGDCSNGAVLCDYDFFKTIYRVYARSVSRNGDAVHIAMVSANDGKDQAMSKRSLTRVMENLEVLIKSSLRKGDIFSKCSASQYLIMLPQSNYENSRMVINRIIKSFYREYPHTPAKLDYTILPLEPKL